MGSEDESRGGVSMVMDSSASSVTPATLEAILQRLSNAVTVVDESGHYVYANEMAARMCGFESVAEMLRTPPPEVLARFELTGPDGQSFDLDELPGRRALRGEAVGPALVRYVDRRTGQEYWTDLVSTIFTDPARGATLAINTFRDVTDQVRADQAREFLTNATSLLAESLDYEETLRMLARLTVPLMADWCSIDMVQDDGAGVRTLEVAHVDPGKVALARQLGERFPYDPDAKYGVPEVIRTGQAQLIREISDELLVEVSPDEELLSILRELGLHSSMCVPLKARGRVLGAITMVTAESRTTFDEAALALAQDLAARAAMAVDNAQLYRQAIRSNTELRTVLSQMVEAVVIVDPAGRVTFVNEAVGRLLGPVEEGRQVPVAGYGHELLTLEGEPLPVDLLPIVTALQKGEEVSNFMWRIRHPDGTEVVLATSAAPLTSPDGQMLGAVSVSRDMTVQYELDQQKDQFLLAASHDLMSPLTLTKGIAQLMHHRVSASGSADERLLAGLAQIDTTTDRMARLVNEMLDVTRMRMGRPLPLELSKIDLVSLVRNIADAEQSANGDCSIEFESRVDHLEGLWDGFRLERCVSNLLSNAVKFGDEVCEVRVLVDQVESGSERWALVAVSDRGRGIPAGDLPYVFERFRRGTNVEGRVSGSGIGLAAVKQIVEQHGGSVEVQSREGSGTTVTLTLPIRLDEAATDARPEAILE